MPREFIYYLKLYTGGLLHVAGHDWQDAARRAGIDPALVKRHMPVKIVLTAEEEAAKQVRLSALRERSRQNGPDKTIRTTPDT